MENNSHNTMKESNNNSVTKNNTPGLDINNNTPNVVNKDNQTEYISSFKIKDQNVQLLKEIRKYFT
jgi:hypothetical protein